MPFSGATFEPETLALLQRVFDDVWRDLGSDATATEPTDIRRNKIAERLMAAASQGERDPTKLKAAALGKSHP